MTATTDRPQSEHIPVCRADHGDQQGDYANHQTPYVWVGTSDRNRANTIVVAYDAQGDDLWRRIVAGHGRRYAANELTPKTWQRIHEEVAEDNQAVDAAIAAAQQAILRRLRRPGRPRQHHEPRQDVRVALPVSLIEQIDAASDNRTAYIEQAVREHLARS